MKAIAKLSALLLITVYSSLFTANAQVPQAFNYQAVARDNSGNILSNQSVGIKVIILQGSSTGSPVYTETFTTMTVWAGWW